MNILLVTGLVAGKTIEEHVKEYIDHSLYLLTIPMPIAAFITPKVVVHHLRNVNVLKSINNENSCSIKNMDLILVPGLMRQDTNYITEELNVPCYKGPSNVYDIILTLDVLDSVQLSTSRAADVLIREKQYTHAMNIISEYDNTKRRKKLGKTKGNLCVGDCPIGKDFPMRVLGEIAGAPTLTDDELLDKVSYYIDSGADMIDVGMHAGENHPDKSYRMVKLIKENYDIPVSIDSMTPEEIRGGLRAGCDMVLSLDHGNYDKVINDVADYDAKAVIIPTNYEKNYIPINAEDRVKSLERLDKKCEKIETIADLLLDPINSFSLTESILAYKLYRNRNPLKPIFFGVGNVSELLDADSNGVNAVLGGISMELGASILFTPESSTKTRNSIRELKTASNMMLLARLNNSIPKNLGIDLVNFKDKYKREDIQIDTSSLPHISAVADGKFVPDTKGSFKIVVEDKLIKAILFKDYEKNLVITGTTARAIYEEILRRDLISRMEHAAYLGMELEKAEIALKLDKTYIQDFPIF